MSAPRLLRSMLACTILLIEAAFAADGQPKPSPNPALDVYAKPGKLVAIGSGRRLNLRCSGSGSPTVILEAGATADSLTWSDVQPRLAKFAHVCSYDRAGLGFSDEGPMPRDLDAEADDLHALIVAAQIKTPFILVGHSRGSNIARRYADKHAADLAALVLLDPPAQHVAEFAPAWAKADDEGRAAAMAFMQQCAKAAESGQLAQPSTELARCLRGPDPRFSAVLNAAQRENKLRPAFWHTVLSTYETNSLFDKPVPAEERHDTLPILILAADSTYADVPPGERKGLEAARAKTNKAIAATSTRSEIIPVAHSSHEVPLDRPDAVVDALHKAIQLAVAEGSMPAQ